MLFKGSICALALLASTPPQSKYYHHKIDLGDGVYEYVGVGVWDGVKRNHYFLSRSDLDELCKVMGIDVNRYVADEPREIDLAAEGARGMVVYSTGIWNSEDPQILDEVIENIRCK